MSTMGERYDGQAWADWAIELDPKASWDQRAEWAGVKRSSMFRYKNGEQMVTAECIVNLADHYKVSPLPGMIAAGYVTREEVEAMATEMSVDKALLVAEDRQLADHILMRLEKVSGAHPALTEPLLGDTSTG